jgi:phage head maturation protease
MTGGLFFPYRRIEPRPAFNKRFDPPSRTFEKRSVSTTVPISYDSAKHEVTCAISSGAPVRRFFGTEVLKISKSAIDLSRLEGGKIPLLDSHKPVPVLDALGIVTDAWVINKTLFGTLRFNQTKQGRVAEGMVKRGELFAVSVGMSVQEWSAIDADGDEIAKAYPNAEVYGDDDTVFTAERWTLLETSLTVCPSDPFARTI